MYTKEELKQYIGRYVFLLKDEEKGYVWEVENNDSEIVKAIEGVGYVGFKFRERVRTDKNKGIGLYKIIDMQIRNNDVFAYVDFITLITSHPAILTHRPEIMLFDIMYASILTCGVDDLWSFEPYQRKNPEDYNNSIIRYRAFNTTFECNCEALDRFLQANGYYEGNIPDRTIKFLEKNKLMGPIMIIETISQPSKMMVYAKELSDPEVFESQNIVFPELYDKLNKQSDVLDFLLHGYDITEKLYDYFCRAHIKFEKYYGGDVVDISMEDEMKMVLEYERAKKEKEKAEKKARRKAAKKK